MSNVCCLRTPRQAQNENGLTARVQRADILSQSYCVLLLQRPKAGRGRPARTNGPSSECCSSPVHPMLLWTGWHWDTHRTHKCLFFFFSECIACILSQVHRFRLKKWCNPPFHVQTREMVLSSVGFFSHNVVGEIECIYWTPGGERLADLQSAES